MRHTTLPPFEQLFARPADARAEAPGRVNLIGEHTDYNGGWVLPCAIPQKTVVEIAHRDDDVVEAATECAPDGHARLNYRVGDESRAGVWLDYVMGVTTALRAEGLPVPGMSLRIHGEVPLGAGLSSSASLLVALLRAIRALTGAALDEVTLARLAHVAEHDFVGAPVGIMDQMACSLARDHHALFLDTRSLAFEHVPMPEGAELLVVDSGVAHRHADGDYRARRAECEMAAQELGVAQLRDVDAADLARLDALPEPLGRRARHVVTENARVLAAVDAMKQGDLASLGRLFVESHRSMRDDFQVSVLEVDALVESAIAQPGCHGARLTGGGFGGSVVALVDRGTAELVGRAVVEAAARGGAAGTRVLVPEGARA
jgi:galactokinase